MESERFNCVTEERDRLEVSTFHNDTHGSIVAFDINGEAVWLRKIQIQKVVKLLQFYMEDMSYE